MRKGDGGPSTRGGGAVTVDQVGVGWVCTIVNGASVPWLIECALHKRIGWIDWVDTNFKISVCDFKISVCDICGET